MADYAKHQGVRFAAKFTVDGTLTDPSSVSFFTKTPNGTETEYRYSVNATPALSSTGKYYADITLNQTGTWYWRWWGTTAVQAAAEGSLTVGATQFSV